MYENYDEWRLFEDANDSIMECYRDDVDFDEMDPWDLESYSYL